METSQENPEQTWRSRLDAILLEFPEDDALPPLLQRLDPSCCSMNDELSKCLRIALAPGRTRKTLLSLEAPISLWTLRLLAKVPAPHPTLVRRAHSYHHRQGHDLTVTVISMNYMLLASSLRSGGSKDALAALTRIRSPLRLQREFSQLLEDRPGSGGDTT